MQTNSKKLTVLLQHDINVFLYHAYPLCIILAERKLIPWYYEHFIQIYSMNIFRGNKLGWSVSPAVGQDLALKHPEYLPKEGEIHKEMFFDFLDSGSYRNVLNISTENEVPPSDIIQLIIRKINTNHYCHIFLDEYYLEEKKSHRKNHFIHESLIIGYNNDISGFTGIGFDVRNNFTYLNLSYSNLTDGYRGACEITKNVESNFNLVQFIKRRNITSIYPFSLNRFIRELSDYTFSKGESSKFYAAKCDDLLLHEQDWLLRDNSRIAFGVDVYENIVLGLNNIVSGKDNFDYRYIHLLYEHKKCILDRLNYVSTKYQLEKHVVELIVEYKKLVKQFNIMRIKFLKYQVSRNMKLIYEIINFMDLARSDEVRILVSILNNLHE